MFGPTSFLTSRRFYLALGTVVALVMATILPDEGPVDVDAFANAFAELGLAVAAIVFGLLGSYGIRDHPG